MRWLPWSCLCVLPAIVLVTPVDALAQYPKFLDKDANTWGADLNAPDAKARRSAAFALGKMGMYANSQVPALVKVLQNSKEDAAVREAAAFALGDICKSFVGARGEPSLLPALQKALSNSSEDELVRRSAAYALGCMGQQAVNALETLDNAAGDKSLAVKQNVAWALGEIGKSSVLTLKKLLEKENDPLIVRDAANSLARLGKDARPAMAELLRHCQDLDQDPKKVEMRKSVLGALVGLVNKDDQAALAPLKRALGDADLDVRRNAALALSNIGGPKAVDAVPVLVEALQIGELEYRRQAAAALRNIGPAASVAVPALIKALQDPDAKLRANAAVALGGIGDRSALTALAQLLVNTSENPEVRQYAAVALRDAGIEPRPGGGYMARPELVQQIPLLVKIIENAKDDPQVRALVLWPFRFFDDTVVSQHPEFLEALQKVVASEPKVPATKMMRYDSACLLGRFKEANISPEAMNTLSEFLKDTGVIIYTGTSSKTEAVSTEKASGSATVQKTGKGDGRIIVVQALTYVGKQKLKQYPEMVKQMHALVDNPNTDQRLKELTKKVLEEFGL